MDNNFDYEKFEKAISKQERFNNLNEKERAESRSEDYEETLRDVANGFAEVSKETKKAMEDFVNAVKNLTAEYEAQVSELKENVFGTDKVKDEEIIVLERLRETIAKIDAEKQAAQDKLNSEEFNKKLSAAQTKIQTSKDKVTSAETAYNDAQATLDKLKEDFFKILE